MRGGDDERRARGIRPARVRRGGVRRRRRTPRAHRRRRQRHPRDGLRRPTHVGSHRDDTEEDAWREGSNPTPRFDLRVSTRDVGAAPRARLPGYTPSSTPSASSPARGTIAEGSSSSCVGRTWLVFADEFARVCFRRCRGTFACLRTRSPWNSTACSCPRPGCRGESNRRARRGRGRTSLGPSRGPDATVDAGDAAVGAGGDDDGAGVGELREGVSATQRVPAGRESRVRSALRARLAAYHQKF